jgi:hypothetical protein
MKMKKKKKKGAKTTKKKTYREGKCVERKSDNIDVKKNEKKSKSQKELRPSLPLNPPS